MYKYTLYINILYIQYIMYQDDNIVCYLNIYIYMYTLYMYYKYINCNC